MAATSTSKRKNDAIEKEQSQHIEEVAVPKTHGSYTHVDETIARKVAANVDDFMTLVAEADAANQRERGMPLTTAFRVYPKAIAWSMVLSSCLIMEGYDTSVVGSYAAYPAFMNRFGTIAKDGTHQIPPDWQNGISGARNAGEIIGLQFAGFLSDRFGYRWTLIFGLVVLTGLIFIPFYAHTLTTFLVGNLLMGIPWGVFQTMTTAYAAEVCPVPLRHYLTCFVNLCWIIGQFIKAGVLVGFVDRRDEWGYKIPFALQWIWPIPITIGTYLAPESPWWCIRSGRKAEAELSLKRLARSSDFSQRDVDATLALMLYTDEMEKQVQSGTRYRDCFKGVNLRRTEIVCMIWLAQTMSGTALSGLSAFFYEQAGISDSNAFKLSWGQSALGAVGTIASWFVLDKVGRKTLMFSGMCVIFVLLMITGCMGIPKEQTTATSWAAGTMVLLISATADFSIGPIVYTIVSEIPSTRLRAKSIILARNTYNAINVAFVNIISFRQLSPLAWDWGAKAAFFWAGTNMLFTAWIWFRLPETKGRTFAELDILFTNKIPARKFAKTKIETLGEGTENAHMEQAERIRHP
ncbi:sugar transporter [Paraphaeosphaeria sporulosa]|uniref:Sugar transporter n=1 Tax=Paraphaeosphaeria sporulosa TaxID=1460663 RepID=A0A177CB23_9PLEO|nr:sugar transporter [Paraphaeosphaeria sporulosa]OAG04873.1 sugar transporter [Paraphaeosphaeria sporulosa]